jgi:3'-phosphoadenosine 5'-phosphosulfate sulfotransferase (PAPS reductase)/FAD synthetase
MVGINQNNIISLSGGKDSTAMLLMMLERNEPIHSVVFFDTGWEFPQMLEHIDHLEQHTGIKVVTLHPPHNFNDLLVKYGWPAFNRRWCTREKIRVVSKYCKDNNGLELIGFAADEEKRTQAKEFEKRNVRFPLIEWGITEANALEYCKKHGFDWGGLYDHFDRVSCFCCPLKSSPEAWKKIRKYYPPQWKEMLRMDNTISDNKGFYGYKTVNDLDRRFADDDRQMEFDEVVNA